jgi:hypothetical protein
LFTIASRTVAVVASAAAISSAAGCGGGGSSRAIPEPGAALVKVTADKTAVAAAPDELLVWAYDDHGRLWDRVRVPEQGALALRGPSDYGTLLIQPGAIDGPLRVHVRGLAAGVRVADGAVSVSASQRGKSAIELQLAATPMIDADEDDVPDAIDDCPAMANPNQGGCGVAPEGTDDGAVTDASDASTDGKDIDGGGTPDGDGGAPDAGGKETGEKDGPDDEVDARSDGSAGDGGCVAGAGAGGAAVCPQSNGGPCASNGQCTSGVCADGVCCNMGCAGACRSCNQPAALGMCQAYVSGADPERECGSGAACNGAGACTALPDMKKANGQPCSATAQCVSGFCADGVCCNSACGDACQSCSTGACVAVKRADDVPQCTGTKTCNPRGDCVAN